MNLIKYLKIPHRHLGRDFKGCDCFGLVRLFYQQEFGIELPDYQEYQPDWHLSDARKILRLYTQFGFSEISLSAPNLLPGDILLLNETGYPKHLGVVVERGSFLHVLTNGAACHSWQQGHYRDKIHSAFRYDKGLPCK